MLRDLGQDEAQKSLINLLLGFFGVVGAFLLLPRTIKFAVRRFITGMAKEIVLVILTGLLTEKLVSMLERDDEPAPRPATERDLTL